MVDKKSKINFLERVTKKERPKIKTTLPELYRSVNLDGIIIECNDGYAKRLGYTVDEVIGMSLFEHTSQKDQKQISELFEIWKKTGRRPKKEK